MGATWSEPDGAPSQTGAPAISLARLLPDAFATIPEDARALAERALLAPRLDARDEDLAGAFAAAPPDAFGLLVAEGVVLKETTLATRSALEVLSRGDFLVPPLSEAQQLGGRAVSRYLAHGAVSLAVLGKRFRAASRRWPQLAAEFDDGLARQAHRASAHLAMLHAPRVDERIRLLFEDLGERCGRMTPDGIVIEISLTHDVIGRLVGSQRPTVSLALQALAASGALCRVEKDRWMIPRDAGAL